MHSQRRDGLGLLIALLILSMNWLTPVSLPAIAALAPSAATTTRVSVASDGAQSREDSYSPTISGNGRYVAFVSQDAVMAGMATDGRPNVFVHDRLTGETTRESRAPDGGYLWAWGATPPSLSDDGRRLAFEAVIDGGSKLVLRELQSGQSMYISNTMDGEPANANSVHPSLSGDGRFVAFSSVANDLVPNDTNSDWDQFVYDDANRQISRVSVASDGAQANSGSLSSIPAGSVISTDGHFVVLESWASNLVSGDTNEAEDVFVYDRQTGEATRVSVSSDGAQANGESFGAAISGDGRFVAFHSDATNLVENDTNGSVDVFVHDRVTHETRRVSVASGGVQANGGGAYPALSIDGRFVAFISGATNLVPGDVNLGDDIFVHDQVTGETTRVSVASDGSHGIGHADGRPAISDDGRFVAFQSDAGNLVPNDTNNQADIFVHDRGMGGFFNESRIYLPLLQN